MWLPNPTSKDIADFRALAARSFGVELSEKEAARAASRVLHLYFIKTYAYSHLCQEVNGVGGASSTELGRPADMPKTDSITGEAPSS